MFLAVHPKKSATQPFYDLPADAVQNGVALNWDEAMESVEKMEEFEAAENIFVVLAHDEVCMLAVLESRICRGCRF